MKQIYTLLIALLVAMAVPTAVQAQVKAAELAGKYDLYGGLSYNESLISKGLVLYGYYRVELVETNQPGVFYLANHLLPCFLDKSATEKERTSGLIATYNEAEQILTISGKDAAGRDILMLDDATFRYYYIGREVGKNSFEVDVYRTRDGHIQFGTEEYIGYYTTNDDRTAWMAAFAYPEGFVAQKCDQVPMTAEALAGNYTLTYSLLPNSMERTESTTLSISAQSDGDYDGTISFLGCSGVKFAFDDNAFGFITAETNDEAGGFSFVPMQPDGYLHVTHIDANTIEFDGPVNVSSNAFEGVVYYARAVREGQDGVQSPVVSKGVSKVFAIDGRELRQPMQGVNIIDGKKVIK